jgi:WD40 repeat protein
VTASFDSTEALWRWRGGAFSSTTTTTNETDLTKPPAASTHDDDDHAEDEWEFTLVLDGHDSEIKSAVFSPSGIYLATCSRDKSVWIWEDVGASEADDEWETVAVLNEHDGDVKAVAWCPDVPGRVGGKRRRFGADVLASASYDGTVRVWREDFDGDWVCVAVLGGHEGTVWGVQWEPRPREGDLFPRLLSWSADGSVRVWELQEEEQADDDGDGGQKRAEVPAGGMGSIPNTMRASLRETWRCAAVLPATHHKDVYSAAWSARTGLVASAGSDGALVVYREHREQGQPQGQGQQQQQQQHDGEHGWSVVARLEAAHGPYEINHVAWCARHDAGCERKGEEEMLVTTGDDGQVRPWAVGGL